MRREEQRCELSLSPFTDIFCPNAEMQRFDYTHPCGRERCRANLQIKFRQLQLNVRRINVLISKARIDREILRKRFIVIRQQAAERGLNHQAHPECNWIVTTAAEHERNIIRYGQQGQASLLEMARLKGVRPTAENIRNMMTLPYVSFKVEIYPDY